MEEKAKSSRSSKKKNRHIRTLVTSGELSASSEGYVVFVPTIEIRGGFDDGCAKLIFSVLQDRVFDTVRELARFCI